MAPKFATQEWADTVAAKMRTDTEYQKRAKPLTFMWCSIITDCPGGVDRKIVWDLKEGIPESVKIEEAKAPSEWRKPLPDKDKYFVVNRTSYEVFAKMNRREITAMAAISQKLTIMETDMPKFMPKIGALTAWTDLMSTMPCEY